MHVLTIYAHSNPKSFCHAVLDEFTAGLREAGHSTEVIDLYAIGFDPVLRPTRRAELAHRKHPGRLTRPDALAGSLCSRGRAGPCDGSR